MGSSAKPWPTGGYASALQYARTSGQFSRPKPSAVSSPKTTRGDVSQASGNIRGGMGGHIADQARPGFTQRRQASERRALRERMKDLRYERRKLGEFNALYNKKKGIGFMRGDATKSPWFGAGPYKGGK